MPPALSDDEQNSASEDEIPLRGKAVAADDADVDEDDEGDEDDEDEYVVEKILGHDFGRKGKLLFDVKWQGYEDEADRTWEPEENLEGARDVLNDYYDSIGGRPEPPGKEKKKPLKRKDRKSAAADSESGTPATTNKRAKKEKEWHPPPGSWEEEVSHIETVDEKEDPKTGTLQRYAFVVWKNQQKTQHPLKTIYRKAPQKMLEYYESHLVFTFNPTNDNTDINGEIVEPDETES